ncbi:molybdopterin molybdotransferase MoeA [Sediminibacterium sp.]|uniref:molybdopterin molybdotransferase MoeA n=1 Tax=Sediminibacterium sp. TaxID=1917865 RepID=UPI003F705312
MITVNEAKQLISSMVKPLSPVSVPLIHASGMVTAEAVFSPIAMPLFTQSSMDGFAIQLKSIDAIMPIQAELPAGTSNQLELIEGHAIKVFTGGPVPKGADCVIQKEWVSQISNAIQVIQKTDEKGLNIREPGSSVEKNDLVVAKGTCLHPYQLAMMASLGINEVLVYPAPVITLIITGNELVKPGQSLHFGQVYESNSIGLAAALKSVGVNDLKIVYVRDSLEATSTEIKHALNCSDMVLLTGGVSVGDYDYVAEACKQEKVELIFHGVKQKPGKPLLFGIYQGKFVFGLPGNPSSVLHCFQQYVKLAIELMTGQVSALPIKAKLTEAYHKKPGLVFFLKGFIQEGWVTILPAQASYQVGAFSKANCWVELPAEASSFHKEQAVTVYLF